MPKGPEGQRRPAAIRVAQIAIGERNPARPVQLRLRQMQEETPDEKKAARWNWWRLGFETWDGVSRTAGLFLSLLLLMLIGKLIFSLLVRAQG
jgi:hypothetical protein